MDLPPTSKLRFLDTNGQPIDQPAEWRPALVEIRVPADEWEQVQLWCQHQPVPLRLQRLGDRTCILAEWPRSGTGHYQLRCRHQDQVEDRALIIQPQKISPAAFDRLLDDLDRDLPVSVALVLQRLGGLAGVKLLPPAETTVAQEVARLQRAIDTSPLRPGLADLLPAIARDPHHILATTEPWVQREHARRPHPARLVQAIARGNNLDADGRPSRVIDVRVEHTVDVYENRLLKAYVQHVDLRLRRLEQLLKRHPNPTIADETTRLAIALRRARRQAPFLDQVTLPSHLSGQTTMVLLKRPRYRAMHAGYLEFHRSLTVRLDEPALAAPLENLPRLYQVWGTLKVVLALLDVAETTGYRVHTSRLVGRDLGGIFMRMFSNGQTIVDLVHPHHNTRVRLIPERHYTDAGPIRSVSFTQIPDIAVEITRPGSPPVVYLFDPKYKLDSEVSDLEAPTGSPKKVDIDKMHAYRDAIRDTTGNHVVAYAATLYPGATQSYGNGEIEALSAIPGADASLDLRLRAILTRALALPG